MKVLSRSLEAAQLLIPAAAQQPKGARAPVRVLVHALATTVACGARGVDLAVLRLAAALQCRHGRKTRKFAQRSGYIKW